MSPRLSRVLRWSGATLLALCGLALGCYLFRAPLLRTAARAWMINDAPAHADAILVLGGGLEYRPFAAARLYNQGVAPLVLVTQPELPLTARMGLTRPEHIVAREVLLSNGVPASAIQFLGTNVTSTRDEALAFKQWAAQTKAHSVIIPTELFHTRRVRWMFRKALRGTDAEVHPVAVDPPHYTATNWWQTEDGLIAFQNEVVKSLYYLTKY